MMIVHIMLQTLAMVMAFVVISVALRTTVEKKTQKDIEEDA